MAREVGDLPAAFIAGLAVAFVVLIAGQLGFEWAIARPACADACGQSGYEVHGGTCFCRDGSSWEESWVKPR